jgi:hypothetical protein
MSFANENQNPWSSAKSVVRGLKAETLAWLEGVQLPASEGPPLAELLYERERVEDYLYLLDTIIMQRRARNERP